MLSRATIKSMVSFACLLLTTSVWSATEFPPKTLTEVVERRLTGLEFENLSKEEMSRWSTQAKAFLRYRKNKMRPPEKLKWVAECLQTTEHSPFCEMTVAHIRDLSEEDSATEAEGDDEPLTASVMSIVKGIQSGDYTVLAKAKDRQVYRALKQFNRWDDLENVAKKILEHKDCLSTTAYTTMAQKAEEFLPADLPRMRAVDLYEKSVSCGKDAMADRARFRSSLLQIYDQKCTHSVAKNLDVLAGQKGGDYTSRAVYWRYHCAKINNDSKVAEQMRDRMLKEFPLSYHTLLLKKVDFESVTQTVRNRQPQILFRTAKKTDLNARVKAIEFLLRMKEPYYASDLMRDLLQEDLEGTEPHFRLYLAALTEWFGEAMNVSKFKLLNSVFKDDTSAVSYATLRLFYPKKRFDVVERFGAKLDPYLVMALIRQESAFNTTARSGVGAMGLMQLMPRTARLLDRRVSRRELFDAKTNVRLGVKYFNHLIDKFGGDGELALASYNAGPERIEDWKRRYPTANRILFLDLIPFKETREYVAAISRNYFWYLALYYPDRLSTLMEVGGWKAPQRGLASGSVSSSKKVIFTVFDPSVH